MIRLNDNNIFVGQIKQLLKDFNLPACSIGSENKQNNKHYIEGQNIYLNSKQVDTYIYNKKYTNLTTNLKIENSFYDRYTHRYLGRYLKFLKQYNKINLMSMYNWFDQSLAKKSVSNIELGVSPKYIFDIDDPNYIIYSIPYDWNENYTIGIKSSLPVEIGITIEDFSDAILNSKLLDKTRKKICVNNKILLKSLKSIIGEENEEIIIGEENEESIITEGNEDIITEESVKITLDEESIEAVKSNLEKIRLLIKVPASLTCPIVILEGDFTQSFPLDYIVIKRDGLNMSNKEPAIINPQLLSYENTDNYLLADKMLEYLTGNVINPLSEDYDIVKLQKYLISNKYVKSDYLGIWSTDDNQAIQNIIKEKKLYQQYDVVGYCDSTVESSIGKEISSNESLTN